MTIERGMPWGEPMSLPESAPVAGSDRELASLIEQRMGSGTSIVVGLTDGDLHRTLGSPRHSVADLHSGSGMGFPMDIGVLSSDEIDRGGPTIFTAHLIATTSTRGVLWRGRTIIVMNAAFRGAQNLAPRSHPNDGRLDVIDGRLGMVDRRRALDRTTTGSHVPHPDLRVSHVREKDFESDTPLQIHVDGVRIGSVRSFAVRCIPDAATIIV